MSDQINRRPGIECPTCHHNDGSWVLHTFNQITYIIRKRICRNPKCNYVFTTKETIIREQAPLFDDES